MTWHDNVFPFWCKGFHIIEQCSSFRTIKVNTGKVLKSTSCVLLPSFGRRSLQHRRTNKRCILGYKHSDHTTRYWNTNFNANYPQQWKEETTFDSYILKDGEYYKIVNKVQICMKGHLGIKLKHTHTHTHTIKNTFKNKYEQIKFQECLLPLISEPSVFLTATLNVKITNMQ
jgi:hypothetical protein